MGKLSRDKGKRGEREVVDLFREHGFKARRGVQFKGGPDSPDVIVEDLPIHPEVKRTERLHAYDALQQAKADAAGQKTPVVFHRKNEAPWIVLMDAQDWFALVTRIRDLEEVAF